MVHKYDEQDEGEGEDSKTSHKIKQCINTKIRESTNGKW